VKKLLKKNTKLASGNTLPVAIMSQLTTVFMTWNRWF